jgi:hypothetical protein
LMFMPDPATPFVLITYKIAFFQCYLKGLTGAA